MADLSSLMDYYYESMYPEIKALEEERLRIIARLKSLATTLAISALVLALLVSSIMGFAFLKTLGVCFLGAGFIVVLIYQQKKSEYDMLFKDNVIEKIIHFIDPTFVYRPSGRIKESDYDTSGLLPQDYDRFSGSDLVEGERKGIPLRFSHLLVEKRHERKNGAEEWQTLFQGLFLYADFHKDFKSKTYVLPDVAERSLGVLGGFLQKFNFSHGKLMRLDHVEFEKYFVVYGDDAIETRYILTYAFMERIVNFYKKNKNNLYIGFVGGKIYLALEYTKPFSSPSLMRSVSSFSEIKSYFEFLDMIFDIIEEFKLDQKLWGKR